MRNGCVGCLLGGLVLALFLCGCAPSDSGGAPSRAVPFGSDQELEAYLKRQFARSLVPESVLYLDVAGVELDSEGNTSAAGGDGDVGAGEAGGFSATNVQEAGVDEADVVKTDGRIVYLAGAGEVQVVELVAGGLESLGSIEVGGRVDDLYLYADLLVVLYTPAEGGGGSWGGAEPALPDLLVGMPYWLPVAAQTGVLLVEVGDPRQPRLLRDWRLDGNLVSSRRIGAHLHLVQQFLPDLPPIAYVYGADRERQAVERANAALLDPVPLEELVPGYSVRDGSGALLGAGQLVASEDFLRPPEPAGASIVAVVTLDLDDVATPHRAVGAVLDAHHVYASATALYLAAQRWQGVATADGWPGGETHTAVHGFSLGGDQVTYVGSGRVPGTVLNQFSLSEYRGVLRLATTTGSTWDGSARNHVYCLRPEAETLAVVGELTDLAPGETIYAARFLGSRGFLVTFVKVDPLLTLDLTDPAAPRLVGELKVPGYSDYIHPLGDNHLLTIGKDAVPDPSRDITWYQGVQLSIFDVTDFAAPQLLHRQRLGDRGTESEALYEHKAFTYWSERGLLALPVQLSEHLQPPPDPWTYGQRTFSGVQVYRVGVEDGFVDLGRIATSEPNAEGDWGPQWTRGLFVDERVLAATPGVVRAAVTADIAAGSVLLDLTAGSVPRAGLPGGGGSAQRVPSF